MRVKRLLTWPGVQRGIPEEVVSELRPKGWAGVTRLKETEKRCTEQPVQRYGGVGKQDVFTEQRSSVWLS